ncbi:catalytic subunit of aromatic ring-opening dioxygenase [Fusarium mexicanum]|uniref:Catalytic subunit of aromatic ring-opening dioxygenase n=1 Tax=Fusarium mexicanum TaxID=751941 RepID=A0A8H5I3C2_9HYPO|nr:catalytic subunit of aromatic ring-opening dioxygenase [Fusarium mexicanum]
MSGNITGESVVPTAFWSHGSPLMCCKESASSAYWSEFGKEAKTYGIRGLIFIGAHWEELDDRIRVATKTKPEVVQMDMVPRSYWENYRINIDIKLAERVVKLLDDAGFPDVREDPTFDWHDDTITPARWMFPDGTPPATVVSLNARYNPTFHVKIGKALSALRREGILICGTGGAVHNLYRNNWFPVITRGDNFQEGRKPAEWALEFEKSVSDVIANNMGPHLAGALTRLAQSPRYKDAHPTDDHFYPLLVIAGAAMEDNVYGRKMAQTWELQHMCNNQFVWGDWPQAGV